MDGEIQSIKEAFSANPVTYKVGAQMAVRQCQHTPAKAYYICSIFYVHGIGEAPGNYYVIGQEPEFYGMGHNAWERIITLATFPVGSVQVFYFEPKAPN